MKFKKTISVLVSLVIILIPVVQALAISNITVIPSHNSASVTWETDEPANGAINYGLTQNLGLSSSHPDFVTSHDINLVGLSEGQLYYYEVVSSNASGPEVVDNNNGQYYTFQTKDSSPPPRVENLEATEILTNQITLDWDDVIVEDFLTYVIKRDDVEIANTSLSTYTDSGLSSDTAYNYKVAAVDTSNNYGLYSLTKQFRTLISDTESPILTDIRLVGLTESSAIIAWNTNEAAISILEWGLNSDTENIISDNDTVTEHQLEITGLLNDTLYYYKVTSCDAQNNCKISAVLNFKTGIDFTPPTLEVTLPDWHNSDSLDISGSTEGLATVRIYVNDELRRSLITDIDGLFNFFSVELNPDFSNIVRVVAIDQIGLEVQIEKTIQMDTNPPIVEIEDIPPFVQDSRIFVSGTTNEQITLTIDVLRGDKLLDFPERVNNLRIISSSDNSIELEWDEVSDAKGYVIYRNGKRMTSFSDNHFIDPVLNKSSQYTYEIAAYNDRCNEGDKSSSLSFTTPNSGADINDNFEEIVNFCDADDNKYTLDINGAFTQGIDLFEGENLILITAFDKASNTVTIEKTTILDSEVPQILEHNLFSLTPSYISDVTVSGKVSIKPGQKTLVHVFVNDKRYSEFADEEGFFNINVELEREIFEEVVDDLDYDPERRQSNYYSAFGGERATGYSNIVTIIAEAESGLESEPVEGEITLATCGYGSWYSIDLGEPTPSALTPRLMLEGLGQIGIPVNHVLWQGGDPNGSINFVDVTEVFAISENDKERYDLDWVQNVQYIPSRDKKQGYAIITLKKLDTLIQQFMNESDKSDRNQGDEFTTLEMERFLSDHRLDDNECLVPGFGCIRIPIMMEIDFSYFNQSTYLNRERYQPEFTKQRQCWDVEIAIDTRLPSDEIPEQFLIDTIDLLNQTIDAINEIIEPLNAIKEAVFYGCAGSMVLDFAMAFQESYSCEFNSALSAFSSDSGNSWNPAIARTGQCKDQNYDDDQESACLECEEAVLARKKFENTLKWVCDRIFCPSAPTFQNYVKTISEREGGPIDNNPFDIRSDCAYADYKAATTYDKMKVIVDDYRDLKESDNNICDGLHPQTNQCCAFEYMSEWDSTCLLMNELVESKCIALSDDPRGLSDPDCTSARKLWNSVAGFCEPDGRAPADIVPSGDLFKTGSADYESNSRSFNATLEVKNEIWFRFLIPGADFVQRDGEGKKRFAEIGRITDEINSAQENWKRSETSRVSSSRVFKPEKGVDALFEIDVVTTKKESKDYDKDAQQKFVRQYEKYASVTKRDAEELYEELQLSIGVSDKKFVVDPTSGILRSFQCGCLPGITSYLNLWKRILDAVKICLETVLVTGDGSTGMCKAVLSVYVCDLIYDLISCFSKKYGTGTERTYEGGIGNFIGALTSAGTEVSNTVTSRYGQSSVWKSMFAERKLVHAVCLWAFTGTWDFDVAAILEEDISIDVESVAFVYPCERRFVSFNPATNPSGLTTNNYHFGLGMVAGSEISYSAELICSDDYSCDTASSNYQYSDERGYYSEEASGACDCVAIGEQRRGIRMGPGTARRGQTIEEEVYQNILDAPWRYDKLRLNWNSHDSDKSGVVECEIKETGGAPPAFCKLDLAEGKYRCDLGTNDESYIRFFNQPTPVTNIYYPSDHINLDIRLSQVQPESTAGQEFNQFTKYLSMDIYNQGGSKLNEQPIVYNFNGNGIHEIANIPNFLVEVDDFYKSSSQPIITSNRPIRDKEIRFTPRSALIKFKDGEVVVADSYYLTFDGFRDEGTFDPSLVRIIEGGKEIIYDNNAVFVYFSEPYAEDSMELRILNPKPQSLPCQQDWRIELKFYDSSDVFGIPSDQPSLYNGLPVEETVKVRVQCDRDIPANLLGCPVGEQIQTPCICGVDEQNQQEICEIGNWCNLNSGTLYCEDTETEAVESIFVTWEASAKTVITPIQTYEDIENVVYTGNEVTNMGLQIIVTFTARTDINENAIKLIIGGGEMDDTNVKLYDNNIYEISSIYEWNGDPQIVEVQYEDESKLFTLSQ